MYKCWGYFCHTFLYYNFKIKTKEMSTVYMKAVSITKILTIKKYVENNSGSINNIIDIFCTQEVEMSKI